jgi:hypothetical protein
LRFTDINFVPTPPGLAITVPEPNPRFKTPPKHQNSNPRFSPSLSKIRHKMTDLKVNDQYLLKARDRAGGV